MTLKEFLHKITGSVFQHQVPRLKKRGEELFPLLDKPDHAPHHNRLRRIIEWLVIPPTLCLVDFIGLGKILAQRVGQKEPIDPRLLELIDELDEPPGEEEQKRAIEHERIVQSGGYGPLL